MLSRKALAIASLYTVVCNVAVADEKFRSADFLAWPEESRNNYIITSALMAGVIAAQNRAGQAECINRWITDNKGSAFKPVQDAMARFPDNHPTGVIAAVLDKACGVIRGTAK